MRNRDDSEQRPARETPVGRPRGAAWRSLQADGVVWEGQVLLVGDDVDLAARMIVTHRRVAFVRGGDVVLDIPRTWLRPEPILRRDGVLDLFVTMPGTDLFDEPQTIPLRMREGHPAAGHIIAMLAPGGVRRIAPDALTGMERARESAATPRFGGFWDDAETARERTQPDADTAEVSEPQTTETASEWVPYEPPDKIVRLPSNPPRQASGGYPITGLPPRDQRRSPWGLLLRLGALTALLVTAAALGAGKIVIPTPGARPILAAPTATVTSGQSPTAAPIAALSPAEETAVALGVGGPSAQTTAATAEATQPPTETTAAAAATATTAPAIAATGSVFPTPAAAATPAATPTATAAPSPTAAPPPTEPAAATAAPALGAASPALGTASPAATLTQPAAVAADEAPAQEIVVWPLRVAITNALRAESLPKYGLPPGSGDWVLLTLRVTNSGDAPASLAMNDLRLFDRGSGTVFDLDSGTAVIARLAGFDPAWAPGDTITLDPGKSADALILYLLPPGTSTDLTQLVGQASIDLAPSLALGQAGPAAAPELVEATVTDVLDGARIAVAVDGGSAQVRYLGIVAPIGEACFAADATAANAQLVAGQQVWLEREATDRGDDGAYLRDVWITNPDGSRALVSARLLEAGAAVPAPQPPDTRYEAWHMASGALGRSNGAGLWAACPAPPAPA